ncbi:unnamed protein product [Bursaphelenchus xylophilus]|uniref:(pine wood nematode) hypothetical protein n=1 Tax=Bursaphelenchus xylophilus TaxID=6326 RepID=A0A7I8XKW5_BURXY|nr:unnamed protein product [Bursaphelenchus xylophilus]CAG9120710.1 unnamed protein product [Bursaphelenchus xylophilus]
MATYDEEGNGFGYKLVGCVTLSSLLLLVIKSTIIWSLPESNVDYRLQRTFITDKSVPGYVFDVCLATAGMLHTIFVLRGIMAKVQGQFSRSLTQSYEMRQTKYTLQWIKRMVTAFAVLILIALPFIFVLNYLYLVCDYNTNTVDIQAILGLLLTMTETYNLACTLFLYDEFPQLKKAVYKDFSCILPTPRENTSTVTRNEEAEAHFNNLRSMFEQGNVPNR